MLLILRKVGIAIGSLVAAWAAPAGDGGPILSPRSQRSQRAARDALGGHSNMTLMAISEESLRCSVGSR